MRTDKSNWHWCPAHSTIPFMHNVTSPCYHLITLPSRPIHNTIPFTLQSHPHYGLIHTTVPSKLTSHPSLHPIHSAILSVLPLLPFYCPVQATILASYYHPHTTLYPHATIPSMLTYHPWCCLLHAIVPSTMPSHPHYCPIQTAIPSILPVLSLVYSNGTPQHKHSNKLLTLEMKIVQHSCWSVCNTTSIRHVAH